MPPTSGTGANSAVPRGRRSAGYDLNGNMTSKTAAGTTQTFAYDRENRLVSSAIGTENVFTAIYDYRSRRLEKTENGDTVKYLYDSGVSVLEYDAEGSLKTFLVRAGGYGGGVGDVVYSEKDNGANREFFLYNGTGTTSVLTNDAGAATSSSRYDAWGQELATTGTTDNVRKFSTKERSEALGLDYFGFRYYDPLLGRFTTRDPSGYPDGPNNYIYCRNNPVSLIDPLGLASNYWDDLIGTISVISQDTWAGTKDVSSAFWEGGGALLTGKAGIGEFAGNVGGTVADVYNSAVTKNADRITTQINNGAILCNSFNSMMLSH